MGRRYFSSETFDFLQDLELFNERAWFQANKDRYETHVREPMLELIEDLRAPLHEAVSPHLVCDPRKAGGSMFRINRDTRFAKDKSPYKTQASARFRHDTAGDVHAPGLYLHLEPGNCLAGGGTWMPPPEDLRRLRQAMVDRPEDWVQARDAKSLDHWELIGDSLKRAPQGFSSAHPLIDDLRRRSCAATRPFTEKQACGPGFLDLYVERATEVAPLIAWQCRVLGLDW